MEQKLKKLMSDILKIPQEHIKDTLAMKDTNTWDSLKHMDLIVGTETTFEIELTVDDIVIMKDVKTIKRILSDKGLH